MLSDAKNLWWSATSVLSSALEKLDAEIEEEQNKDTRNFQDAEHLSKTESDLEIYKKLLDDAQMQQFELSKQSRIMVAEKEAEILFYKNQLGTDNAATSNVASGTIASLEFSKLMAEKTVIENSLAEMGEKLKSSLHTDTEVLLLKKQFFELTDRHNNAVAEFTAFRIESEAKEKHKADTIDSLVAEYSQLAAESELNQTRTLKRNAEIILENETLSVKIHALEHSITELADRSIAGGGGGSSNAKGGESFATLNLELREARTKVVNLQFDIKEKDEELSRLQQDIKALKSGRSSSSASLSMSTAPDAVIVELQQQQQEQQRAKDEISNLKQDVARLIVEKREAEDAGRKYMERAKALQRELTSSSSSAAMATATATPIPLVLATVDDSSTGSSNSNSKQEELVAAAVATHVEEIRILRSEMDLLVLKHQLELDVLRADVTTINTAFAHATQAHVVALAASVASSLDSSTSVAAAATATAAATIDNLRLEFEQKESQLRAAAAAAETNLISLRSTFQQETADASMATEKKLAELKQQLEISAEMQKNIFASEKQQLLSSLKSKDMDIGRLMGELSTSQLSAQQRMDALQKQLEMQQSGVSASSDCFLGEISQLNASLALTQKSLVDANTQHEVLLQQQAASSALLLSESNITHAAVVDQLSEALKTSQSNEQNAGVQGEEALQKLKTLHAAREVELLAQVSTLQQKCVADIASATAVLEAKHTQELSDKLAEHLALLRSQLGAQHDAAMLLAAATATSALTEQLAALTSKLQVEATERLTTTTHAMESAFEAAKVEIRVALGVEKHDALAKQLDACNEAQSNALSVLANVKEELMVSKLGEALQTHRLELDASIKLLKQQQEDEKAELNRAHVATLATLQLELNVMKEDMQVIHDRHAVLLAETLKQLSNSKDAERVAAVAAVRQQMQLLVEDANSARDQYLADYTKERKLRKVLHNRLQDIQGNIRVLCRVRPVLEVERRSGEDVDVTDIPNDEILLLQRDAQTRTKYEYDKVFGQTSTQEEVFEAVQPLIVSVLDGYNVCIFAYGQTGSGKTFTMEGSRDNIGVSPRAIRELFAIVESLEGTAEYILTLSMLEIYNETIRDLMDSSQTKDKLDVRQTAEGNVVVGLNEVTIQNFGQVQELLRLGNNNRAVGSHDMNEHSSRSHSIITVACRGKNKLDGTSTFGKLHLIDLAGSERLSKTDASGDRLKEAQNINKSLSALGDVINALGNKKATHVPYRNSKLTFLLQDSLGGTSKVLSFVNISPAVYNIGETVCSLNFATRCRITELGEAKKQTASSSSSSAGGDSAVASATKAPLRKSIAPSSSSSVTATPKK